MPRFNRRRRSSIKTVIQSFKKVINVAPTSRLAATTIGDNITVGTDSVAAGQTGPTDAAVPTGSVLKFIEIQFTVGNLVLVNDFVHWALGLYHSGQTPPSPIVIGGSPLRNQIHRQGMFTVGQQQNSTHVIKFKIPPRFQRVREGDFWQFTRNYSAVSTDALQIIYKFYR